MMMTTMMMHSDADAADIFATKNSICSYFPSSACHVMSCHIFACREIRLCSCSSSCASGTRPSSPGCMRECTSRRSMLSSPSTTSGCSRWASTGPSSHVDTHWPTSMSKVWCFSPVSSALSCTACSLRRCRCSTVTEMY